MTMEEVALHDKEYDGWMVLQGKVYNVGPYVHYHPGGVNILKPSLGKDGTSLFEQYHRWVGIENLIGKLLIGYIDDSPPPSQQSQMSMPPPKPGLRKLDNLLNPPIDRDSNGSGNGNGNGNGNGQEIDEKEETVNPWEITLKAADN